MSAEEKDFLSRWSRRKRGEAPEPEPELEPDAPAIAEEEDEAAALERLGLKHPDALAPGDDFSAYLSEKLPQRLRALALRRLWRSDPGFGEIDGLLEYGEDFTGGGVAQGTLATAWEIGRGFARKAEDVAAPGDDAVEDAPAEAAAQEEIVAEPAARDAPAPPAVDAPAPVDPPRRRMAFRVSADPAGKDATG